MRRLLLSCAVVLLLAMVATPATAMVITEEPAGNPCWTTVVNVADKPDASSRWTYRHTVEWCGDGDSVTRIDIKGAFVDERAEECKVAVDPETNRDLDPDTPGLDTFSMGTLVCDGETVEPLQVCPWVIVAVHGDGTVGSPTTGIERATRVTT
jgi:hypothetical protein